MTESTPTSPTHAERAPRDPRALVLQVLRLPAALAILALVAQLRPSIVQMMGLYPSVSDVTVWFRTVLAAAAFMLTVAIGRQRRAPVALLLVEVTIAAGLAFIPPYLWGPWLNYHPFSRALGFEFVAALAIAWFAICVAALVRQWRKRPRRLDPRSAGWLKTGSLSAHTRAWLPWLRPPVLVGMLRLVAAHREGLARAWEGAGTFEAVWVPLTLTALAFMTIVVVGRRPARAGRVPARPFRRGAASHN
jgi:hypothetical protein